MKRRIVISVFTIIISVAVIAGGTMAWFTHSEDGGKTAFTAGTVSIEAGRIIDIEDSDSYKKYSTFSPDKVIDVSQGKNRRGGSVAKDRSYSDVVLDDSSDAFFSLGFGGYIIVEFESPVYAPEIVIVTEITQGAYPTESAEVYVSTSLEDDWKYVGTATNEGRKGNEKENKFDITGIPYVKYVKVVDVTEKDKFDENSDADGFDVKSIQVKGYYAEEDNWNPGDKNLRIFEITNTGTKAIHLRGKFTGSWYEYDEDAEEWVIVDNLNANVVSFELHEDEHGWEKEGGWFYYKYTIPGTYPNNEPSSVNLKINVCLDGEKTNDDYQGKRYILNGSFEAIQASNGASKAKGWKIIPSSKQE